MTPSLGQLSVPLIVFDESPFAGCRMTVSALWWRNNPDKRKIDYLSAHDGRHCWNIELWGRWVRLAIVRDTCRFEAPATERCDVDPESRLGIELDYLARADGIIFVASADPERWWHTEYYFSRMLAHLNSLGRSPHSLPIVLQVNRINDCDEVLPVSHFEQLGWPVSAIIPTIAYQRRGLKRLMDTMLEQIDARQPAEQ